MELKKKSYPPAERLDKMVDALNEMWDLPFPTFFKNITAKPNNWPRELQRIYRTDKGFFFAIKGILPNLNYDELDFLRKELGLIEEHNFEIDEVMERIEVKIKDPSLLKNFKHLLYRATPLKQPIRCYVLSTEGHEIISYYREDDTPSFLHSLFLRFLCLKTDLFAIVLQHPLTLNLGRSYIRKRVKDVEKVFDRIIKPSYVGREQTSTESKNIRRWLQYFGLLFESDQIFHFDTKRLKIMLVGSVCRFLNKRFFKNGPTIKWEDIYKDLINIVHLDSEMIDLEELVELILDANESLMRWIPSERGERAFRGHKGKQVLELKKELFPPKTQIIEGADFLNAPSIPRIENIDLIRQSKLDELWRKPS